MCVCKLTTRFSLPAPPSTASWSCSSIGISVSTYTDTVAAYGRMYKKRNRLAHAYATACNRTIEQAPLQ
eukprot:16322-Heterococcus_DN1.PRE.3